MTLGQAYMFQHRQSSEQTFWQYMTEDLNWKLKGRVYCIIEKKKPTNPPSNLKSSHQMIFKAMGMFSWNTLQELQRKKILPCSTKMGYITNYEKSNSVLWIVSFLLVKGCNSSLKTTLWQNIYINQRRFL